MVKKLTISDEERLSDNESGSEIEEVKKEVVVKPIKPKKILSEKQNKSLKKRFRKMKRK